MTFSYYSCIICYEILNSLLINDKDISFKNIRIKRIIDKVKFKKYVDEFNNYKLDIAGTIKTDEYNELVEKEDRTEEEETRFNELQAELTEIYQTLLQEKLNENVELDIDLFTFEEFNSLVPDNMFNSVHIEITDLTLENDSYIETFYELLIKKDC